MSSIDAIQAHGRRFVQRRYEFFGILRESPPLHFYLVQFTVFAYLLYRFLSRDYTVYGYLPPDAFDYLFTFRLELWPVQATYFTTFQFVYLLLPRPDTETLFALQMLVVGLSVCGLIGFHPRKAAIAAFVLGMHITGMMICSNAPIDGGTLELCALLILALTPTESFYRLGRDRSLSRRSVNFHWPVFLLLMAAGCFYTFAGINKIKDVGLHWPFALHLENLASAALERCVFKWGRYAHPTVCYFNLAPWTSYLIGGPITLVAEIGFLSVLFVPRWRLSLIVTMAVFHALVLAMAGINFVGTTFLLFLCFDWNMIVRKGELIVNSTNTALCQALQGLKAWDRWGSLEVVESADTAHDLTFEDELGRVYIGLEAFYQVAARCPRLWAISVMSRIPVASYLVNQWVRHRFSIDDGPDTLPMPRIGSEVSSAARLAG